MFTRAIVRPPGPCLVDALASADLGRPDPALAARQHAAYVEALRSCGVAVRELPPLDGFPDATFVEDTALLTNRCAVITRPGAPSRRGEAASMRRALEETFPDIATIEAPGTLDAGDVMMAEDHFFIGLSSRTNPAGAQQLAEILRGHGYGASTVELRDGLHLKSSVSYLDHGNLLVTGALAAAAAFEGFHRHLVPEAEAYAANALWVNGTVLVADGFPATRECIEALGYPVCCLDMSEFRKVDGGLSCLSLRC